MRKEGKTRLCLKRHFLDRKEVRGTKKKKFVIGSGEREHCLPRRRRAWVEKRRTRFRLGLEKERPNQKKRQAGRGGRIRERIYHLPLHGSIRFTAQQMSLSRKFERKKKNERKSWVVEKRMKKPVKKDSGMLWGRRWREYLVRKKKHTKKNGVSRTDGRLLQ